MKTIDIVHILFLWSTSTLLLFGNSFSLEKLSIEQATQLALQSNKNIFVSYGSEFSNPYEMDTESILSDKHITTILHHDFIVIKADYDNPDHKEWFSTYDVKCLPTVAVVDKNGSELDRAEGLFSKSKFLVFYKKTIIVIRRLQLTST